MGKAAAGPSIDRVWVRERVACYVRCISQSAVERESHMRAQATIAIIALCLLGVANSAAAPAEEPSPQQTSKEVASLEKRIKALEAQNAKLLAVVKINGASVSIESGSTLKIGG